MFGLDDRKKLGIGLIFISLACFLLGVLLLFDRALFLIGNMCLLGGFYLLIGFTGTLGFFMKKGKIKGSAFYFGGFLVMVIFRIASIGFLLQLYGIFTLFKSFIPFVYESACSWPFIGKYLRDFTFLRRMVENLSRKKSQV